MSENLLRLFPKEKRAFWEIVAKDEAFLQEIRLRVGQPILVYGDKGEWMVDQRGNYTRIRSCAYPVREDEIMQLLRHICNDSLYAYEDELRQGFITAAGGHRIGIAGQVVLDGESVRTVKHISGLNIRIAHQLRGAADPVIGQLYREGYLLNTLIISPPGCGKTTLLRDLIRQVSDGNRWGRGCSVGVVDERSEIAGCFQGIPQNDVGMRTDVMDGCPKALGMMMLLRSMSPQVIAVDEVALAADVDALSAAANCGVVLFATAHGSSVADLKSRPVFRDLLSRGVMERAVIVEGREQRRHYRVEEIL